MTLILIYRFTLDRRGESAEIGVFLIGESGGVDLTEDSVEDGEIGGSGEIETLMISHPTYLDRNIDR